MYARCIVVQFPATARDYSLYKISKLVLGLFPLGRSCRGVKLTTHVQRQGKKISVATVPLSMYLHVTQRKKVYLSLAVKETAYNNPAVFLS
jgi:hypothetical protein